MTMPDEDRLKSAYRRLLEREAERSPAPDMPPELLQQLAEGTYAGVDREALVDRALAHGATAREFAFFVDVHRARLRPSQSSTPWRRWALAASLVGVAALGVRWIGVDPAPDPMRASGSDAITVLAPDDQALFDSATVFTWRPVADASSYRVEVLRDDGTSVASRTTRDTATTVASAVALASGETLNWWVTATLADGTTRRSLAASIRAR